MASGIKSDSIDVHKQSSQIGWEEDVSADHINKFSFPLFFRKKVWMNKITPYAWNGDRCLLLKFIKI